MADNSTDFNFSINNNIDSGSGSMELIDDFLSDSPSPSPDNIEVLSKPPKESPKKEEKEVKKPDLEKEKKTVEKTISSFLNDKEEEEEEQEEEEEVKVNEDDKEEEATDTNKFSALSKDLFNLGVFVKGENEDNIEINTPEQFLDRFNTEARRKAEQEISGFIGQFGEDYQHAFNSIYVNGVNPKDYFSSFNKIVNFSELDISKEDNQVAIIREALVEQGYDAEDIPSEIERYRNYGDLEKVSKNFQKVLVKKEAQKLEQLEADSKAKLQQQQLVKQQYLNSINTIINDKVKAKEFDGIPLNQELAKDLYNFIAVDKYKTTSGDTLTDFDKNILELKKPENHAKKVKLALLLKVMEKDPSLSSITNNKLSKKSNVLFEELTRNTTKSSVKTPKNNSAFSNL